MTMTMNHDHDHETSVKENRWFWGGGYRRVSHIFFFSATILGQGSLVIQKPFSPTKGIPLNTSIHTGQENGQLNIFNVKCTKESFYGSPPNFSSTKSPVLKLSFGRTS